MRHVPPSTRETAFNCPHCGALANQQWHSLTADTHSGQNVLPFKFGPLELDPPESQDAKHEDKGPESVRMSDPLKNGWPHFGNTDACRGLELRNVFVAQCYTCRHLSVWVHEKLVFPARGDAPPANPDLPADIRRDYDEAGSILDLSPRGAAALLRLAIQKLCKELGESGENLNKDIGALVAKGLDDRIKEALDSVRVIGNNAVHPGEMDLRDDCATAERLFELLNLIAERTLSDERKIKEVYGKLPARDLKAIKLRDSRS